MAAFVLDASVVLAVALQETNRQLAASILGQVVEDGAAVPGIWHVEVGNALMIAERRKATLPEDRNEALLDLSRLPVTVDAETAPRAWHDTLLLADRQRLTLYDVTYLELARRLGLPLATFDAALRRAAAAAGAKLL
ncbi:MAG TPA: type II toxin-antitoxin system VapC family toxin [Acetobacteraceae bacterium]|jgi:predicted nucleic acid-binding protein|nr:type II toxin-antitoxin system VapC family toxin [Acetobacteraceae bacterium]